MRSKTIFGALLVSVALCSQGFGFELLDRMLGLNGGGCGECNACAKVACCEKACPKACCPEPACCEKACPKACEPACCETATCGKCKKCRCTPVRDLFAGMKDLFEAKGTVCETGCCDAAQGCCPEPACCEKACPKACEPACGCEKCCKVKRCRKARCCREGLRSLLPGHLREGCRLRAGLREGLRTEVPQAVPPPGARVARKHLRRLQEELWQGL